MRIKADSQDGTSARSRQHGERGYVLLVFTLFAALLVIGFARILPQAVFEGQREKEEEAIFRGQQYQHAIQLFVRKFGRYPNTLEELENTNNIRFLRRRYPDPLTKEGEWRLIHIGPGGVFPDSLTASQPPGGSPASATSTGLEPSPEMYPAGKSPSSQTPTPGLSASSGFPPTNVPVTRGVAGESSEPALRPSANPTANPAQQPRAAASARGGPQTLAFGGGGIAGVASQNTAASIKVLNGYSQYNEWEFIYDFRSDPLGTAAVTRASPSTTQPGGQPGAPGQQPATPRQPPALQNPPEQPPRWLGGPPPGVRPTPRQFPPSPISPGTSPLPRQR
ncbi:MAG: hypothetical protein A3G20_00165 [Acidobacteria bacterium RIFCSPLOWO2_12_FULL_59_11]|nr:MAG: hypothetical protein A3G20_00165 [Acidobacteria bacterium RIFCSPLOWO2_12_FULL_59_11]